MQNNKEDTIKVYDASSLDKLNPTITKQLTVVGFGTCGKTSILTRHIKKMFCQTHESTVFNSTTKTYVKKNKSLELRFWDTAGQEDFSRFRHLTLPSADYVLVCFAVDCRYSFIQIRNTIITQIQSVAPQAKYYLVATKIDLRDDQETTEKLARKGDLTITFNEGKDMAESVGASGYFECSSKEDLGVEEVFDYIVRDAFEVHRKENQGVFGRMWDYIKELCYCN